LVVFVGEYIAVAATAQGLLDGFCYLSVLALRASSAPWPGSGGLSPAGKSVPEPPDKGSLKNGMRANQSP
jgi:hypothetical protein